MIWRPTADGISFMSLVIAAVYRFTLKRWSRNIVGMFVLPRKLFRSLFVSSCSSTLDWSCALTVINSSFNDWSSSLEVSSSSFAACSSSFEDCCSSFRLLSCSILVCSSCRVADSSISSCRTAGSSGHTISEDSGKASDGEPSFSLKSIRKILSFIFETRINTCFFCPSSPAIPARIEMGLASLVTL